MTLCSESCIAVVITSNTIGTTINSIVNQHMLVFRTLPIGLAIIITVLITNIIFNIIATTNIDSVILPYFTLVIMCSSHWLRCPLVKYKIV